MITFNEFLNESENHIKVEAKILDKGQWQTIVIIAKSKGWTQIMKDGKWVNDRIEESEDVVIQIGKLMSTEECNKYMQKPAFKQLLKFVEKNVNELI